jgi:hypothetical protein
VAFFMIFGLVGFLAAIFLLWCFQGFSHDLKRGNTIGLFVRPVATQKTVLKKNIQRVVRMSLRTERPLSHYDVDANRAAPLIAKSVGRR